MEFTEILLTIFLYIRVFILDIILYVQQRLIYKLLPPSVRENTRTILIIGDENAFGIGDRFGHTGLIEQLNEQLKRNKNKADGLKLRWRIVSNGKFNSTSKQWLPGERLHRNSLNIYKPEIIIILLGSNNNEEKRIDSLIQNYKIIVDSLLDNNIMVISPGLPNYYNENNYHTANIQLKNILKDLNNNNNDIVCLYNGNGDLSKITALGHHAFTKESNFCSLNSRGYRLFAADLFDDILTVAKKVEWKHWKDKLTTNEQSSTSSSTTTTTTTTTSATTTS